ncbi:MAG: hypothetical protein M1533_01670 [Candidatus Thermoplasmatota archaeon]|jgi:hypothetical protein|nr:hypothetical protein [Candidatus Thermoplasmatota archaeon]MCL5793676.1 hypothetical protein [Candidatus Thermoplasmatota archaeon]
MNIELDIEQVRTFMLMGDVKLAVGWLEKRMKRARFLHMATKKPIYVDFQDAYKLLLDLVKGKITGDTMIPKFLEPKYSGMFGNVEDVESYLKNLSFYVRYSVDRYDVDYPVFDQKRCGDQ